MIQFLRGALSWLMSGKKICFYLFIYSFITFCSVTITVLVLLFRTSLFHFSTRKIQLKQVLFLLEKKLLLMSAIFETYNHRHNILKHF